MSGTAVQLLAAFGVATGFALLSAVTRGSAFTSVSQGYVTVGLLTGVVGIAIPFFLLNRSLECLPASTAALTLTLIPVFAVGTAVTLLMEPVSASSLARGGLILIGLIVLSRSPGSFATR